MTRMLTLCLLLYTKISVRLLCFLCGRTSVVFQNERAYIFCCHRIANTKCGETKAHDAKRRQQKHGETQKISTRYRMALKNANLVDIEQERRRATVLNNECGICITTTRLMSRIFG